MDPTPTTSRHLFVWTKPFLTVLLTGVFWMIIEFFNRIACSTCDDPSSANCGCHTAFGLTQSIPVWVTSLGSLVLALGFTFGLPWLARKRRRKLTPLNS